jgi:hypothetical protein
MLFLKPHPAAHKVHIERSNAPYQPLRETINSSSQHIARINLIPNSHTAGCFAHHQAVAGDQLTSAVTLAKFDMIGATFPQKLSSRRLGG